MRYWNRFRRESPRAGTNRDRVSPALIESLKSRPYTFQSLVEGASADPNEWLPAHWREVQHIIPILLPSANVMRSHRMVEFGWRQRFARILWPGAIGSQPIYLKKSIRCVVPAFVTVTRVRGPRQRAWDAGNREYWCKPLLDALKGKGYIRDDSPAWVLAPPVIDISGDNAVGLKGPCIIVTVRRTAELLSVTDAEAAAWARRILMGIVSDPGAHHLRRRTLEDAQSFLEGRPLTPA